MLKLYKLVFFYNKYVKILNKEGYVRHLYEFWHSNYRDILKFINYLKLHKNLLKRLKLK